MINFLNKRIEYEFNYDAVLEDKLKKIVYILSLYCEVEFNKDITITHIYRTEMEQNDIYHKSEKYQNKPWKSVHQFGRGVDVRSHNFNKIEIEKIKSFINGITYREGSATLTCIHHDIGLGEHFHLQVSY